ncbi:hypothetical protein FACS189460_4550 [Deltaproteobacteria bacterium]|nr:hypothetical protein FACS189460_4550 [Deltaproteobacteria bacterium]
MNPKLRSSVSVVKINDTVLEFFKTNTRKQVRLRVENDIIMEIVCSLDGTKSIMEIANIYNTDSEQLNKLFDFLISKGILETIDNPDDFDDYKQFRRVIHFLEDYSTTKQDVVTMWNSIRESRVLIIGLGAVGSWVAVNLMQAGVRRFAFMDSDVVDISNLHRQFGYTENDIGNKKIEVLAKKLLRMGDVDVIKYDCFLDEGSLENVCNAKIDLIINCADKPTVDITSLLVGKYCMEKRIPHIIGGGYNLHLSLIGQTVLPYETACVKCFEKHLVEENTIDPQRVKKLEVKNRKVGSLGPMCSLIASMIGMESIKILSKKIRPSNINRRGEFDIYKMNISYKYFERREDCEWCGQEHEFDY